MIMFQRFFSFAHNAPHIFSALTLLAVLVTTLLAPIPAFADWGPDIQLTNAPENSEVPSIAVSGNFVHVAWQDMRDGNYEIYYKRSTDFGATWGADVRLTNAAGNSKSPSVAVSGNIVHILWFDSRDGDDEIYYKRSADFGATWGADTRLTNSGGLSDNPSVAVLDSVVHVVWYDQRDGNPEIYYKRSTDGGITWGSDTRLTIAAGNSYTPCIAVSGSIVHVAWHDNRDGNEEIYYKRSTDGGATWGADTRLTNATGNSALASIAVSGNNVHIAWSDERDGNWEIYYKRSTDGGTTWGTDTRLTNAAGNSKYASIAVSGNNVHVVWTDERSGNRQVFYRRSIDGGSSWNTDIQLVNTPGLSDYPSIAVSGSDIHVAWQDNSGPYYPRWDIFYKRDVSIVTSTAVSTNLGSVGFNISAGSMSGLTNITPAAMRCPSPAGYFFPYGQFGFNIDHINAGQQVLVTIRFPNPLPLGIKYYKCINGSMVDFSSLVTRVNEYTLMLTLTDGGPGDADGTANGIIVDPGGPAFPFNVPPSSSAQVPTAAQQKPMSLSNISVKSASLSATRVTPGTPVTVTANLANTGTGNGTANIKVYVNGAEESSQGVTVNSGGASTITFDVSRNEPGVYTVYVGGANAGSFTVDQFTPGSVLFISSALVFFALVIGVIYMTRRRTGTGL
jgi:hypothetical protein